jgi:hypothetical protein
MGLTGDRRGGLHSAPHGGSTPPSSTMQEQSIVNLDAVKALCYNVLVTDTGDFYLPTNTRCSNRPVSVTSIGKWDGGCLFAGDIMQKPKHIHRLTLDAVARDGIPQTGVYVIAYMGHVLYVGKTSGGAKRLEQHMTGYSRIGAWMIQMKHDWHNIRVDFLEVPDNRDNYWITQAEMQLIRRFSPLFNNMLVPECSNARNRKLSEMTIGGNA